MDTYRLTAWLTRFCARHWFLHGLLDPVYRHAERRGYKPLVRENALRLLERAHAQRLTDDGDARDTAALALDRFEALAVHGDAEAAFHVAEAHRTGFGRPRNHWKALEHYERAQALGHPQALERLKQVRDHEEVEDPFHEVFGRRALLKATYAPAAGERRVRSAFDALQRARYEGLSRRGVLAIFACAGLVAAYLAADIYFNGMGGWRPDPARVAWGLFGKIHPPRDASATRVLPGWMRPDAGSVTFVVNDFKHERTAQVRLGDLRGKVVYLQVVDGRHPALFEAVPYLKALDDRRDPSFQFYLLYQPDLERPSDVNSALQWALEIAPGLPAGPRAFRPLGELRTFPMNFVLDRQGRIRQRWAGYSQAITEEAIKGALAES